MICDRCFHAEVCDRKTITTAFGLERKCPHQVLALKKDDFRDIIDKLSKLSDVEIRHSKMDESIYHLLRQLGYNEAMDIYEKTEKWYA